MDSTLIPKCLFSIYTLKCCAHEQVRTLHWTQCGPPLLLGEPHIESKWRQVLGVEGASGQKDHKCQVS